MEVYDDFTSLDKELLRIAGSLRPRSPTLRDVLLDLFDSTIGAGCRKALWLHAYNLRIEVIGYRLHVIAIDGREKPLECFYFDAHEFESISRASCGRGMVTLEPNPTMYEGGCDCRAVRYRLSSAPMIVHCCHCRWCQRESGASFALNAMYEASRVHSLGVDPEVVNTPSQSGKGQRIARCPCCRIAVWSHYAGSGPVTCFVRVGTLDQPDAMPPDVHIFTASKQPWIIFPAGTRAFAEYYDRASVWSADALARWNAIKPLIETYKADAQGLADAQYQPKSNR